MPGREHQGRLKRDTFECISKRVSWNVTGRCCLGRDVEVKGKASTEGRHVRAEHARSCRIVPV